MIIKIPGKGPVAIYGDGMFVSIPGDGPVDVSEAAGDAHPGSNILIETGFNLLLETGDAFLMEA